LTTLVGLHGQPRRDRDGDGWADVPGYRRAVVRPRLFWRDSTGQSLLLTVGTTVETRTGGTLDGRLAPDGAPYPERLATTRVDGGLVGRWRIGATNWLQTRASATSLGHRHRFGSAGEPDRHNTAFAEIAITGNHAGTDLLVGGAITIDWYRSDRFPVHDYRLTVPGLFAQAERSLGAGAVAASVRVDRAGRYGIQFSPRLSGLLRAGHRWSVRASLGGGFTAPTPLVDETERNGLARLRPLVGLESERAISGSIDGHGALGPLELNASVFTTRIDHAVQARPIGIDELELINAAGPTRSSGLDLSVVFRRGGLGVTGSYTFVDATEPDPDGPGRQPVPLTPRYTAGVVSVYESETSRIGLEIYYTGTQALEPNPYRPFGPAFVLLGLLGEREILGVRAFVNFENLTDVRLTRSHRLVRPFRAFDGTWTVDAWGPLDGRVINGGVRVAW
jgi:iron complex outermembrane receptor protein